MWPDTAVSSDCPFVGLEKDASSRMSTLRGRRRSAIRCSVCQDSFHEEDALDDHLARAHPSNLFAAESQALCAGRLCPILGCPVWKDAVRESSPHLSRDAIHSECVVRVCVINSCLTLHAPLSVCSFLKRSDW